MSLAPTLPSPAPSSEPAAFPSQSPTDSRAGSRPYLVFMRTGANGLYPRWLAQEPERNWDLFLSCYTPTPADPAAIATETGGYNKLEHFRDCVTSGRLDLSPYRQVLLADDDLDLTVGSLSAFFAQADRLGLTVSHPAQDWSGYWSLRIMLRNPLAEWRETNFVEIMCPCFDTAFVARKLADIPVTRSTWGSDYAFSHLARAEGGRVGIIDTAVIRHVKPIQASGAFYRKLAADGVVPADELNAILDTLPPIERTPRVIAIHVRPGHLAGLRHGLAGLVEKKKRDIMKLFGHRQDRED